MQQHKECGVSFTFSSAAECGTSIGFYEEDSLCSDDPLSSDEGEEVLVNPGKVPDENSTASGESLQLTAGERKGKRPKGQKGDRKVGSVRAKETYQVHKRRSAVKCRKRNRGKSRPVIFLPMT